MARYQDAIEWIAYNDDSSWVMDEEPSMSVTAALIGDLWGKDKSQLIADIRRVLARAERGE
jgi:hypothetical protein